MVTRYIGAGADTLFKEIGAKGSKLEHTLDVCGGSVVNFGFEGILAVCTLHDGGCCNAM